MGSSECWGISYASYRVAAVMEELIRYEPDLFLIYSGHDEFLEGRTHQTVLEAPKPITAFAALASRTRIYSAGKSIVTSLSKEQDGNTANTELKGEVDTILANSVGPQDYQRDDTFQPGFPLWP